LTENIEEIEKTSNLTIVKLDRFYGNDEEKIYFQYFLTDKNALKKIIIKKLLLRLYLEKESKLTINVKTYIDNKLFYDFAVSENDIPTPDKTEEVNIDTVRLVKKENDKNTVLFFFNNPFACQPISLSFNHSGIDAIVRFTRRREF
jgi:hypothetical protein